MDEELDEPVRATRLLAWVTAGLLALGTLSAGVVAGRDDGAGGRVVSAAGGEVDGVDVPTTTTAVRPPPTNATPIIASTTTIPPPPTTAPTTTAPRPTTTTTKAPATTTTAKATGVSLTVVNQHPSAVKLTVNGRTFTLAPGEQSGPVAITRAANGNDVVEVFLAQEPSCGTGDADSYFPRPGNYTMTVVAGPGLCRPGMPGPGVKVTPA